MRAYVLMDCKLQTSRRIVKELLELNGVIEADCLWGRYEVIAVVEVQDLDALEELVCDRIKAIKGVVRTMTQIAKKQPALEKRPMQGPTSRPQRSGKGGSL